jgi:CBS domain-containing protein/RNA polymerase-binding transcription factor DksA
MMVNVKTFMSGDPVAIHAEASTLDAFDRMLDRGIRHLPVIDAEHRVVGVLSIDDLRAALPIPVSTRRALSPEERIAIRDWRVGEIMTHAPETLHSEASLQEAAETMADRHIGCLPIVDDSGHLEGILTETDVLHALATSLWSEQIPKRREKEDEFHSLVAQLQQERERIASQLDHYHDVERELSEAQHDQPMDEPERSADLREVHLTEAMDALAARRLEAIDRALDHAAQGRLSVCDRCGGAIPVTRLRALPGTTVCVACARAAESEVEQETPFERVPGGRAETGRPELGSLVGTRFGEGRLLRIAPFGTCRRCGDVEGHVDRDEDTAICLAEGCRQPLHDVRDRAIVAVGEREVYVDPVELETVDPAPFD